MEYADIGIARREKIFKKEIIGFIAFEIPYSQALFFKHSIKKGFQFNLFHKDKWRIPFVFTSSSNVGKTAEFKFHDIVIEFNVCPGIYTEKYTLAFDVKFGFVPFRHIHYTDKFQHENPGSHSHWEETVYHGAGLGLIAGVNFKRFGFYLRSGYKKNIAGIVYNENSFYALAGLGFRFGTKPMDKVKAEDKPSTEK